MDRTWLILIGLASRHPFEHFNHATCLPHSGFTINWIPILDDMDDNYHWQSPGITNQRPISDGGGMSVQPPDLVSSHWRRR